MKVKIGIGKRMLAVFLTMAMILTLQGIPVAAEIRDTTKNVPQNPVYDTETDTTTWDYVYFGSYPQTEVMGDELTEEITGASYDDNGDAWVNGVRYRKVENRYFKWEKIKWNVLQNNGSTLFVVSDKALDFEPYNETCEDVSWSVCTLRDCLNDIFYNTAFDAIEQNSIVTQENNDGVEFCDDNVFLLSYDDVQNIDYGFSESDYESSYSRRKYCSEYAKRYGDSTDDEGRVVNWWLRSPGCNSNAAAYVGSDGYVGHHYLVSDYNIAVVPALHINLSSDLWSVTDDENREDEYEVWEDDEDEAEDVSITKFNQPQYNVETDTTDWDYVCFGSYPQNEVTGTDITDEIIGAEYDTYGDAQVNGVKYRRITRADTNNSDNFGSEIEYRYFKWEPIKWRIMKKYGSTLYMIADTALDCKNYDNKDRAVAWKDSSIRSWLNKNFYNTAFSSAQRKAVIQQQGTNDNVQLLSVEKAADSSYGFCSDEATASYSRRMSASDFAYVRGVYTSVDENDDSRENCWWWLRSEESGTEAERVYNDGSLDNSAVNIKYGAVVPTIRIDVLRTDTTVNPKYNVMLDTTEWSYVYFGSYPQTKVEANAALISAKYDEDGDTTVNGTKYRRIGSNESGYKYFKWEPIRWRVLQIDGSMLLLAADMGLDCQKYDEDSESALWKNSSLRSWLNDTFYNSAFGEGENGAIIKQSVDGTRDNVFLLSSDEVTSPDYGFYKNTEYTMSRQIQPSDYSGEMGVKSPTYWWLRSSGSMTGAKEVAWDGSINQDGHPENNEGNMIVPALYVNVNSDLWTAEEEEEVDLFGQRLFVSTLSDCEVTAGESVTFEITASGGIEDECTYQWYYAESPDAAGTEIEGATQPSYIIESSTIESSGYYYCVVKNGIQSVVSNRAKLTVKKGENPGGNEGENPGGGERLTVSTLLDCEVREGESVTFEITAQGGIEGEYTYQWYHAGSLDAAGTEIEGATQRSYTIESNSVTTTLNGGYYYCVVKNGTESVVSNRAKLTVKKGENPGGNEGENPGGSERLTVSTLLDCEVREGESVTFEITARGGIEGGYTYQWYHAGSPDAAGTEIEGATQRSYTIESNSVTTTLNGGYYYCVVKNGTESVVSNRAKLTVKKDENPGGNEGENPGDNEGENPGDNEGNKPDGNTGGNQGGSTGGNTGGTTQKPQTSLNVSLKTPSLTIKLSASNAVKLTWKKVSGATGYIIYRSESADGKFVQIGKTSGTSYTNKKLKKGKTYYYKITAYKGNFVSGVSNTVFREIIGKPAKLVQKKIKIAQGGDFVISWKKVKNAQKIEIQRSVDGKKFKKWKVVSAKKSKVTFSYLNLPRKHKYSFRVRAYYQKDGIKVYGKASGAYAIVLN